MNRKFNLTVRSRNSKLHGKRVYTVTVEPTPSVMANGCTEITFDGAVQKAKEEILIYHGNRGVPIPDSITFDFNIIDKTLRKKRDKNGDICVS